MRNSKPSAHEIAHVRRRDNLYAGLHMLVEAVFWFHPLVWFIGARLLAERERACDEAVAELCPRPEAYAEGILRVCEFCIESPLACVSGITGADLKHRVTHIMTGGAMRQLSPAKKAALGVIALVILAAPIVLGVFDPRMHALADDVQVQQAEPAKPLAFEVVSIRRNLAQMSPATAQFEFRANGDGLTLRDILLSSIVGTFYGFNQESQSGMPAWANSECYDIRAKVAESDLPAYHKLTKEQRNRMVQALLEDRFKLRTHVERHEGPVYLLTVADGGPKIQTAPAGEVYTSGPKDSNGNYVRSTIFVSGPGEQTAHAASMSGFAKSLQPLVGRTIIDQTGLTGAYDFTFKWSPNPADSDAPSIFTALQEQLGLKLVPAKGQVESLVIDHIERPASQDDEAAPPAAASIATVPALTDVAQTQPAEPPKPLAFEVVSIRQHNIGGEPNLHTTPDGWIMTDVPLAMAIQTAYVPQSGGAAFFGHGDVLGLPAWAMQDRYDITARVPAADLADWQNPQKQPAMLHAMLQAALVERCGLKVHRETKETKVLALVVGKPSQLKPADPNTPHPNANTIPGGGAIVVEDHGQTLRLYDAPMSMVAMLLSSADGTPVQDRTGLTGRYDVVLRHPDPPPAPQANDAAPEDTVSAAYSVAEEAGLSLKPSKGTVETLVVDHMDRPTEN